MIISALSRLSPFDIFDILDSGWKTVTSGVIKYRRGLRDGNYIIDFSADGGATWEEIISYVPTEEIAVILANPGTDYRVVIRDYAMKVDHVLGGTGFDGTEGVDWEEIESYSTP